MVTVAPITSVFDRMASLTRAMDQAFAPALNGQAAARAWTPAVDALETEQSYVVHFDVPGVAADKIEVNFERNTLTVRGERAPLSNAPATARALFIERDRGTFERALRFPQHVEGDKIHAAYANGVLTVTVPKSDAAKPRKIDVKANV